MQRIQFRSATHLAFRYGPVLFVVLAFVHAAAVGWLKWGNLLIDGGRELELPLRLLRGEQLYRDVRYYYGPFAPLLNEQLYRVFGVHAQTLIGAGLVSASIAVALIYRIAVHFVAGPVAALASIAFIYVFVFGHLTDNSSFNFILPYTYSATYGIVAALASLLFALNFQKDGRTRSAIGSALFAAISCLCKLETAIPVLAIQALVLVTAVLFRREWIKPAAMTVLTLVAPVVAVLAWCARDIGAGLWTDNVGALFNEGSRFYVSYTMGTDHPSIRLLIMAVSMSVLGLTLLLAYKTEDQLRRTTSRAATVALLTFCCAITFFMWSQIRLLFQFAALPLVAMIAIGMSGYLCWQDTAQRRAWIMHLTLWVFILAALSRILLHVWAGHYGFYLVPAGLIGVTLIYFEYAQRVCRQNGFSGWAFRGSGVAVLLAMTISHWNVSLREYARHTHELDTPRGHLYLNSDFEIRAIHALSVYNSQAQLLVIPQGAGLAFFSGLADADHLSSHLPMEIASPEADLELLHRWKQNPPDVVVWFWQDLAEFGSRPFGVDYATQSAAWLRANYAQVDENARIFLPHRAITEHQYRYPNGPSAWP